MSSLKKRTVYGVLWDFFGLVTNRGVTFIISIFLARILTPEEFGLVGMVMVFVIMSSNLMDVGLGSALIQKKDVSEEDYSSVFFMNVTLGVLMSLALYLGADALGDFYNNAAIPDIARTLSLIFVINSFAVIQKTRWTKKLNFKLLSTVSILSSLLSGILGIIMALKGYGIWSLIAQILVNSGLMTLLLWITAKWIPKLYFSFSNIRSLLDFGFKIFVSDTINIVFRRLDVLFVGRVFSPALLGFYTRAQSVDSLVKTFSSQSIVKVFFPSFSAIQDDTPKIVAVYQKTLAVLSMVSFLLLGVLYVCADSLFPLLFSAKWLPSVPLFKLMILKSFVPSISALSINVLKAKGRASELLIAEVIKKSLFLVAIGVGIKFGLMEFLYALIVQALLGLFINFYFIRRELGMKLMEHFKIIFPYVLITAIAILLTLVIKNLLAPGLFLDLILSVIIFLLVSLGVLVIFKDRALKALTSEFSRLINFGKN